MMDSAKLNKIRQILQLKAPNTYQYALNDPNVYIGGSLPAMCLTDASIEEILAELNDIDIYTKNYIALCAGLDRDKFCQYIPNEFEDFTHVLNQYDCDMIAVGFYPFQQVFMVMDRFKKGLAKKEFAWFPNEIIDDPGEMRLQKLVRRAKKFFDAKITVERPVSRFSTAKYHGKKPEMGENKHAIYVPYLQFFFGKFVCISCSAINGKMLCDECIQQKSFITHLSSRQLRAVVLGGVNGFGRYITEELRYNQVDTVATSRQPNKHDAQIYYDLNEGPTNALLCAMLDADIIVLNACQTLEHDQKIWTSTIDNFDEELAMNRFVTNAVGYAKLFSNYIRWRRQVRKPQIIVFVDANESFYYDKILDGRHLEINMAKSAAKQVLCTNAGVLASCGALTLAYNPGWMSFHGQEVHNEEHSRLVPPQISAQGLVMFALKTLPQIQSHFIRREYMFDVSVYELIKNPMFYASNTDDEPVSSEVQHIENEPEAQQDKATSSEADNNNSYDMGEDSNEEWFQAELQSNSGVQIQQNNLNAKEKAKEEYYANQTSSVAQIEALEAEASYEGSSSDEFWSAIIERTRQLKRD